MYLYMCMYNVQEEKGMTDEEMARWRHGLSGHDFEQAPGDGKWQGSLVCRSLWGCKELGTTEQLNSNNVQCLCMLLSCSTLCEPMDCSQPGSSVDGILQQKYCSELPFPTPEKLPEPLDHLGSPYLYILYRYFVYMCVCVCYININIPVYMGLPWWLSQ